MNLGKYKLTLIEDWKKSIRFGSVKFAVVCLFLIPVLLGNWASITDYLVHKFPETPTAVWGIIAGIMGSSVAWLTRISKLDLKENE